MKALILAAGRGTRMKNVTDEMPKCLVTIYGKTLLEHQLQAIRKANINDIGIVTGYKREKLKNFELQEFFNPLWFKTNMVSSLECAESWFQNEPIIVSYSDIFYESSAINSLKKCNDILAITYDPNWLDIWEKRFENPLTDAETFRINKSNGLLEIGGKTNSIAKIQGQYMGLLYISPKGWRVIKKIRRESNVDEKNKMDMTQMLSLILKKEPISIRAIPYKGKWGEIDTQNDLKLYEN